jgi:hypothetical protein
MRRETIGDHTVLHIGYEHVWRRGEERRGEERRGEERGGGTPIEMMSNA